MAGPEDLERRLRAIEERNARVEADKEWEGSWTRTSVVGVLTYLVIATFFFSAGLPDPLLNAIVPALAFVLSTRTMPLLKSWWVRRKGG